MPILVSDTSVLIDLERADLLEETFLLPFEFAAPDLLFERELTGELGDSLIQLGLRIKELTSVELRRATAVNRQHTQLSVPDTFAFVIAESRGWGLLTGDGTLHTLAISERIDMHGVLWVFDQLADGDHVGFDRLHSGLSSLFVHPRCRLPANEVRRRLGSFCSITEFWGHTSTPTIRLGTVAAGTLGSGQEMMFAFSAAYFAAQIELNNVSKRVQYPVDPRSALPAILSVRGQSCMTHFLGG